MFPQDSITHAGQPVETAVATSDSVVRPAKPRTPYEVLRSLPRDATPAQQDSAIQATFQPGEIHYSSQPDTLHLPGHEIGVKVTDVDIPIFYEKTFFAKSIQQQGRISTMYGMPGDPVPYTLRNDHIITSVLLGMLLVTLVLLANHRDFFLRQLKGLFGLSHKDEEFMPETGSEYRCQFFLVAQTSMLLGILQFFFTQKFIGDTFILRSDYMVVGVFFAMTLAYFLLRSVFYTAANSVFFSVRQNAIWQKAQLFIAAMEGLLIFPLVLLQVYFDLSAQNVILNFAIALLIVKILTFYKSKVIFFKGISGFLQNILYFCALEIVPLAAFCGAMVLMGNFLKINY